MDESRESLLRKIQRLESEKQQLVQLLHDTEATMAQQFQKSQEETAQLKQLFSSVLPLIKARATAREQCVGTVSVTMLSQATQSLAPEAAPDPRISASIAALEQKLCEIELCASSSDSSEELLRLKQREAALQETAAHCKQLADQLQRENAHFSTELTRLEKENEMLRRYVSDAEDRVLPAVLRALYRSSKAS